MERRTLQRRPILQEVLSRPIDAVLSGDCRDGPVRDAIREAQGTTLPFSTLNRNPNRSAMTVRIHQEIRNKVPEQEIRGQEGRLVQQLNDGYWLIEFSQFPVWNHKMKMRLPLRWYVHREDLTLSGLK